jgi:DNA-binding CsgD family transcriptional regulator
VKNLNRINEAYISPATEFFTVFGAGDTRQLHCVNNGQTFGFANMPADVKNLLQRDMDSRPQLRPLLSELAGPESGAMLKQYIMCRYGALDAHADITADGVLNEPEYVPCPNRGKCKYEGKVCAALSVDGVALSRAETAVFKLVLMPDKLIADTLCISVETVKTHFKKIRAITHLQSKTEMAAWATQKGII